MDRGSPSPKSTAPNNYTIWKLDNAPFGFMGRIKEFAPLRPAPDGAGLRGAREEFIGFFLQKKAPIG